MANIAIFRINYKSDFILTLQSDAGWMTPFCIKFWTGAPSQAYFAGYDGTTYTHCAPVAGDPTKLLVQFDDHHLPIGDLKFQIGYHFTVADFPTSIEDEVINQEAVIIDNAGEQQQVMLDFNGETAPEIEFSLPAYANEAQRIANESQRIANEEQRIATETQRIANEEQRISQEQTRQQHEVQRIAQEQARVTAERERFNDYAKLKVDAIAATDAANSAAALANEKAQLAADKAALAQSASALATEKAQLATDKAALAQSAATLANEKAALAQQKAEYATAQGDYAKAQGDYAKAQAGVIPTDVTRTQTDATFVNGNHDPLFYLRQANSSLAGLMTAAGYTKLNDMPAAQEVNAGLAYDVSVLHPTSGVNGGSTYASLSAALAVIPQDKRKGGMTVKFVQSSDNNYVQFMYMNTDAATNSKFVNVANWQGVDAEPTAGSKNLVASGGVFNAVDELRELLYEITEQNLPSSTFISGTTWETQIYNNTNVWYHSDCVIDSTSSLKEIVVKLSSNTQLGNIDIVFVDFSTKAEVLSITKQMTAVSGNRTIDMSGENIPSGKYYVGLRSSGNVRIDATNGKELPYKDYIIRQGATEPVLTTYCISYEIVVKTEGESLPDKVDEIDTTVQGNTSDILEVENEVDAILGVTPLPTNVTLPSSGWGDKNFNTYSGTDGIFWDIRNVIGPEANLLKIHCKSSSSGTVRVHYLDSAGTSVTTEDFSVTTGLNELTPSATIDYSQNYFVGFQNITSQVQLVYPTDGTGQSRKKLISDGTIVEQTYPYAFWIDVLNTSQTLPCRVNKLEQQCFGITTLASLKSAIINGIDDIKLGECDITLDSTLILSSGTKISGVRGKSILRVPTSVLKGIELNSVEDVIIENITLIGAYNGTPLKNELQPVKAGIVDDADDARQFVGAGYQTDLTNGGVTSTYIPQLGINIKSCEKIEIIGCEIKNFSFYGIANALSGKNYRYACKFENNYINNCYCGLYLYKEAERSQYIANNVSLCQIGLYLDSGTNMFTDCAFSANRVGMFMSNGVNHAHGVQTGNAFTHCSLYSLFAYNVQFGEVFSQCKFGYVDNETGNEYKAIHINNSRGLVFNNCQMIQCAINVSGKFYMEYSSYTNGTADVFGNTNYIVSYTDITGQASQYNGGVNQMNCCSFISGGSVTMSSELDSTNFVMKNNYFIDGSSSSGINN